MPRARKRPTSAPLFGRRKSRKAKAKAKAGHPRFGVVRRSSSQVEQEILNLGTWTQVEYLARRLAGNRCFLCSAEDLNVHMFPIPFLNFLVWFALCRDWLEKSCIPHARVRASDAFQDHSVLDCEFLPCGVVIKSPQMEELDRPEDSKRVASFFPAQTKMSRGGHIN